MLFFALETRKSLLSLSLSLSSRPLFFLLGPFSRLQPVSPLHYIPDRARVCLMRTRSSRLSLPIVVESRRRDPIWKVKDVARRCQERANALGAIPSRSESRRKRFSRHARPPNVVEQRSEPCLRAVKEGNGRKLKVARPRTRSGFSFFFFFFF